jgi:hypothetical protein
MKQLKTTFQKHGNIYSISFFLLAVSAFSIMFADSSTNILSLQGTEYNVAGQETTNGIQETREQGQETKNGYS